MADTKTSALTALTAFTGDETFYVVEDDDGTPVSRRMTIEDLAAGLAARSELSGTYAPRFMGAKGVRSTAQTIPDNTDTAVAFNGTDEYDSDSIHDPASNNTRFTVPTGGAGKWRGVFHANYAFHASGVRNIFFRKNGTTRLAEESRPPMASPFLTPVNLSDEWLLADGDYIEVVTYQNRGGTLDLSVSNGNNTTMSFTRVGL